MSPDEDNQEITCAFTPEQAADAAVAPAAAQEALRAIGAWSDLEWDEMERALDRIRHESKPTPLSLTYKVAGEARSCPPVA